MKKYITDWLASDPVFYNERTLKISNNINDVIDWTRIEFHPEGLNNYLDFGFSVFEQTPLKDVKFLRHSSEIFVKDGSLIINRSEDPVQAWLERNKEFKDEEEVLELIQTKVRDWESSISGNIVLPLSGGYDSRLLCYFLGDRSRVRSFTYGVSNRQEISYEVANARELAKRLGIEWRQIELGQFHNFFDKWNTQYGVSTHAHGMYQIEFYSKLGKYLEGNEHCLSGIIGDAWAGNISVKDIKDSTQLVDIGYTHGMNSSSDYSLFKSDNSIKRDYFEKNQDRLKDPRTQIVETMRTKILLLSYLLRIPKLYGYQTWSPYIDMDVALSMLSIHPTRRDKRIWQRDFFRKVGLDIESDNVKGSKLNYLNHKGMEMVRLKPLNEKLLREIIDPNYVREINRSLETPSLGMRLIRNLYKADSYYFISAPAIFVLKRLGLRDPLLKMYSAYLTLKPLERLLVKRDLFLKK